MRSVDARRQRRAAMLGDRRADAGGDLHGVGAELLDDRGSSRPRRAGGARCRAARPAPRARRRRRRAAPASRRAPRRPSRAGRRRPSARPTARTVHSIGPCATKPPAAFSFAPSTRVQHLVERHAARRHAVGIELHLELAQVAAEPLDRGDAGHGEQPVADLELREVAQRHQVGGARLGLERELEDLVEPAGQAREQRRRRCRAAAARAACGDALGDELARAVVVGVGLELDRDLRDAELAASSGCGARRAGRRAPPRAGSRSPVSSSSAPIAAFCTITLKTGAERSGKTSRAQLRKRRRRRAPRAASDEQRPRAAACAKEARMMRSIMARLSGRGARPRRAPSRPRPSAGTRRRRRPSRPARARRRSRPRRRGRGRGRPRAPRTRPSPRGTKTHQPSCRRCSAAAGTATIVAPLSPSGSHARRRHARAAARRRRSSTSRRTGIVRELGVDLAARRASTRAGERPARQRRRTLTRAVAPGCDAHRVALERVHRRATGACRSPIAEQRPRRLRRSGPRTRVALDARCRRAARAA